MFKFRITNFNMEKELAVSLKSIFGVGWFKSNKIIYYIGFSSSFLLEDLNFYYRDILFYYLESFVMSTARIERFIELRIKKYKDLATYKGNRHELNLPVHGQRTRTNASTQRSKRRKIDELLKLNARTEYSSSRGKKGNN